MKPDKAPISAKQAAVIEQRASAVTKLWPTTPVPEGQRDSDTTFVCHECRIPKPLEQASRKCGPRKAFTICKACTAKPRKRSRKCKPYIEGRKLPSWMYS